MAVRHQHVLETTRIIDVAATILGGMLASGARARVHTERQLAIDAVRLARELVLVASSDWGDVVGRRNDGPPLSSE